MIRTLLTLLLISVTALSWGQNAEQRKLEQKKAQIQKEIREFQELLNKESKKEKSVLAQINEKNAKIKLTQSLINTTEKQTRLLSDDIYLNQKKVNKLNKELDVLKEDYANTLVKSYKSRSQQSRIMFILSSDSFLQAYKRLQYMKQYASFRKMQGEEIRDKMTELQATIDKLNAQKKEKQQLLAQTEKEKAALEKDKKEQEKLISIIKKDKKKYAADIKKKQKQEQEVERQIQKLIREAIAAANRKAAKEAGQSTANVSSSKFVLTKEGKIIADNFKANKGQLPWPVEKGYVSLPYGDQAHPIERTIRIHNSGIEITTEKGASARAVFGGEVSSVQLIEGKLAVSIRHGNFITIYMNLASASVREGDTVGIKQSIGKIRANPGTGETVLKFLITQDATILNPQQWLNPLK